MKSLKESIFGDIEDITDNDTVLIEQFLKDNYQIDGTYKIDGNVVDVEGDVKVKNKGIRSLTNGLFRFGAVSQVFCCDECLNLTSLEGAPKEVGGDFNCSYCSKLTSRKGAPKKVVGRFWCSNCPNLIITQQDKKKYVLKH